MKPAGLIPSRSRPRGKPTINGWVDSGQSIVRPVKTATSLVFHSTRVHMAARLAREARAPGKQSVVSRPRAAAHRLIDGGALAGRVCGAAQSRTAVIVILAERVTELWSGQSGQHQTDPAGAACRVRDRRRVRTAQRGGVVGFRIRVDGDAPALRRTGRPGPRRSGRPRVLGIGAGRHRLRRRRGAQPGRTGPRADRRMCAVDDDVRAHDG